MRIQRTKKKSKKSRLNKIRDQADSNKHWNVFAGDDLFKTNFFMDLSKPSMGNKYEKDMVIRFKFTTKFLLCMLAIGLLLAKGPKLITLLSLGCFAIGYVYCNSHVEGQKLRVILILPILVIQHLIVTEYHATFVLALCIAFPIDVCTLPNWRKHLMGTMIQNLLLFLTVHMYSLSTTARSIVSLTNYTDSLMIALFTLTDLVLFSVVEKFLKEFWVIRETNEKSFRMFYSMIDDFHNEIVILDETNSVLYSNHKFEGSMKRLIKDSFPTHCKEFIHENSYDIFKEELKECIKSRKGANSIVYLLKKQTHLDGNSIGNKDANATLLSSDTLEVFECNMKPISWKGDKSIMVTFKNVMEQKIKQKLLVNQANEISTQFHEVINIIEKELAVGSVEDFGSEVSLSEAAAPIINKLLLICNKCYNDFLFIKNVFEIEVGDLRPEMETFSIKDFFVYSVDLLLSRTKKCNVKVTFDPCLPPEVEGDLLKFRQIITSILDFSLKSTDKIDVQLHTNFKLESGGYIIDFKISFLPKFDLQEKELQLLFGEKDDMFFNQYKIDKNVGLPIHVISKLVIFLGGRFKELKKNDDGTINIEFSLPFNAIKSSNMIVKTPRIRMDSEKSISKGVIMIKSPMNHLRKIRKVGIDNDIVSEKEFRRLPKIEEGKSDTMSCDNLNKVEVSSVRQSIMNFEHDMKRLKGSMKSSEKSLNPRSPKKNLAKVLEKPDNKDGFSSIVEDENENNLSSLQTISQSIIRNTENRAPPLNVFQKYSSDEITPKRGVRKSKGPINTNPYLDESLDLPRVEPNKMLKHPQLDKIRNEMKLDMPSINTNTRDREDSVKLQFDSSEQDRSPKSSRVGNNFKCGFNQESTRLVKKQSDDSFTGRHRAIQSEKESVDKQRRKSCKDRNNKRDLDYTEPSMQQMYNCGDQGALGDQGKPRTNHPPYDPNISFADLDHNASSICIEHVTEEIKFQVDKYKDGAHFNKPISRYGVTKLLIRSESDVARSEEDEINRSKNKSNNFFSEYSSEMSKSKMVMEFQQKLSLEDYKRRMATPTNIWRITEEQP